MGGFGPIGGALAVDGLRSSEMPRLIFVPLSAFLKIADFFTCGFPRSFFSMTPDEIVRGKPLLTRVRTSNDIKYAEDLTSRWCLQGNSNFRKADFEQFLLVEGLGFRYQRLHSPPKASRHLYLSGALPGCSGCDESSTHP